MKNKQYEFSIEIDDYIFNRFVKNKIDKSLQDFQIYKNKKLLPYHLKNQTIFVNGNASIFTSMQIGSLSNRDIQNKYVFLRIPIPIQNSIDNFSK